MKDELFLKSNNSNFIPENLIRKLQVYIACMITMQVNCCTLGHALLPVYQKHF